MTVHLVMWRFLETCTIFWHVTLHSVVLMNNGLATLWWINFLVVLFTWRHVTCVSSIVYVTTHVKWLLWCIFCNSVIIFSITLNNHSVDGPQSAGWALTFVSRCRSPPVLWQLPGQRSLHRTLPTFSCDRPPSLAGRAARRCSVGRRWHRPPFASPG